jgi:hypothetical protein
MTSSFNFTQRPLAPVKLRERDCPASSVAQSVPRSTFVSATHNGGQILLNVTVAGIGAEQLAVQKPSDLVDRGVEKLKVSDLTPGDLLISTGTPDPQSAGIYDVSAVHDFDVILVHGVGIVQKVDATHDRITYQAPSFPKPSNAKTSTVVSASTPVTLPNGTTVPLSALGKGAAVQVHSLYNARTNTNLGIASLSGSLPPGSKASRLETPVAIPTPTSSAILGD